MRQLQLEEGARNERSGDTKENRERDLMAGGGKKSDISTIEGVLSSALHRPFKLAAIAGSDAIEHMMIGSDLAALAFARGYFSKEMYNLIISGHPIFSMARQTHRIGVRDYARFLEKSGDIAPKLGAASTMLGMEKDTGRPVFKRERGVDDATLAEMVATPDIMGEGEVPPEPIEASEDGLALEPDAIQKLVAVESTRQADGDFPPSPGQRRPVQGPPPRAAPQPAVPSGRKAAFNITGKDVVRNRKARA